MSDPAFPLILPPDDSDESTPLGAAPSLTIAAPPRISDDVFCDVLARAGSPAALLGPTLYAICAGRGVDPGVALAFFEHESSFGKAGAARHTLNWGNLRRGPRATKIGPVAGSSGNFAWYSSWAQSLMDFCDLLRGPLYEGAGRRTVAQVIPLYAPSSDGNKPARYIAAVEAAVNRWAAIDPWAMWGTAYPLAVEARGFGIPQRWLKAQPPLGVARGPEVYLAPGCSAQAFAGGVILWLGGDKTVIVRPEGIS
jgi:hypothetical protein